MQTTSGTFCIANNNKLSVVDIATIFLMVPKCTKSVVFICTEICALGFVFSNRPFFSWFQNLQFFWRFNLQLCFFRKTVKLNPQKIKTLKEKTFRKTEGFFLKPTTEGTFRKTEGKNVCLGPVRFPTIPHCTAGRCVNNITKDLCEGMNLTEILRPVRIRGFC